MVDPSTLCERILNELRGTSGGWERLSLLDSQLIVLAAYFVQTRPSPSEFTNQLEDYARGIRGKLLAEAAGHLLVRYRTALVP